MSSYKKIPATFKEGPQIGFFIPGRPITPSEGRAQHYRREGNPEGQLTKTFRNGTTLRFGNNDHVIEIKPYDAFYEQSLVIAGAERDILAEMKKYTTQRLRAGTFDDSSEFDDNGSITSFVTNPRRRLSSTAGSAFPEYIDRFARESHIPVESQISAINVFQHNTFYTANWPGVAHPGFSNDTRFGVRPSDQQSAQHIAYLKRPHGQANHLNIPLSAQNEANQPSARGNNRRSGRRRGRGGKHHNREDIHHRAHKQVEGQHAKRSDDQDRERAAHRPDFEQTDAGGRIDLSSHEIVDNHHNELSHNVTLTRPEAQGVIMSVPNKDIQILQTVHQNMAGTPYIGYRVNNGPLIVRTQESPFSPIRHRRNGGIFVDQNSRSSSPGGLDVRGQWAAGGGGGQHVPNRSSSAQDGMHRGRRSRLG